jgi:putative pyruvate formate lyase activating enzyme
MHNILSSADHDILEEMLECRLCPRQCGANRIIRPGTCGAGAAVQLAKACLHHWEEPCISGPRGSGAVFFTHCSLRCSFCQNYPVSHEGLGKPTTVARLAEIFLELQDQGAHNINLVTPTHYVPHIREALLSIKGTRLTIPVIYNSSGYDDVRALRRLVGLIDIYLPDLKYYDSRLSRRWSRAPDYFEWASRAVVEMLRQVGPPIFDEDGILRRGLMIRHLTLPGMLEDSKRVVDWVLDNLPGDVYLNLMSQYTPLGHAKRFPELNTVVTSEQYSALVDYAMERGLENGYIQEPESAGAEYVPAFDLSGV